LSVGRYGYNHEHRHSGIGLPTANVPSGHAEKIQQEPQPTLAVSYAAHPERFHRRPLAHKRPECVTINDHAKRESQPSSRNWAGRVSLDLTATARPFESDTATAI
jgi:putative transposase